MGMPASTGSGRDFKYRSYGGEAWRKFSRAPRKIDFSANRGPFWSERLRIGTGTKPNHSGAIWWRVIGGAYFSRCPVVWTGVRLTCASADAQITVTILPIPSNFFEHRHSPSTKE
jgi:hypothetical protein